MSPSSYKMNSTSYARFLFLFITSSCVHQSSSFTTSSCNTKNAVLTWNVKPSESLMTHDQRYVSWNTLHNTVKLAIGRRPKALNVHQKMSFIPSSTFHQKQDLEVITEKLHLLYSAIKSALQATSQGMTIALKQSWWCFPMTLILYPIIALINGSYAQMPSWWSMCNLNYLHSTRVGHWICFGFLTSNVFYFLSGLFLLRGIPSSLSLSSSSKSQSKVLEQQLRTDNGENNDHELNITHMKTLRTTTNMKYPLLGWLVICSGGISLLYHSFQAWGTSNIAESLCFIDHGLALSSGCCFLDRCGLPSSKTILIGIISLCMLSIGGDVYPIIHSFWHFGSASVTISWALDGSMRRKKYIVDTLQERRRLKQLGVYSGKFMIEK